jgi:hypothetical protein
VESPDTLTPSVPGGDGATTNDLAGPADFALLDLGGNVVFSGQFFVSLRRIPVEGVGSPF